MFYRKETIVLFVALLLMISGCSGNTPVALDKTGDSGDSIPFIGLADNNHTFSAQGIFGAYELSIDAKTQSAELVAKRTSSLGESYIVNGISYFTIAPCADCLKIKSIALTNEWLIQLTFAIHHPFDPGDPFKPPNCVNRLDLDVFDLALLVQPLETTADAYTLTDASVYSGIVINNAGYTTELENAIEDSAALPFVLVIDDNTAATDTFNKFEMGAEAEFDVLFNIEDTLRFNLYLTMGYGWSATKPQRLSPTYYNPEFNRKSAWKVVVTPPNGENPPDMTNTWNAGDDTTAFDITVEVFDWQIGANVNPELAEQTDIYAASGVSSVSVEIPGMNSALPTVNTPDSGAGTPSDPLVYTLSVANENLLPEGEYTGLVKVSDERIPGVVLFGAETDTMVDSPDGTIINWTTIPEFATYQTFSATIVSGFTVELTSPNGGEEWSVDSHHDITWDTTGYVGDVKLEYSKDWFVSEFIEIIAATENDGVFEWVIPDDESDTVRVRVTLLDVPALYDDSDADFSIIEIVCGEAVHSYTGAFNILGSIPWGSCQRDDIAILEAGIHAGECVVKSSIDSDSVSTCHFVRFNPDDPADTNGTIYFSLPGRIAGRPVLYTSMLAQMDQNPVNAHLAVINGRMFDTVQIVDENGTHIEDIIVTDSQTPSGNYPHIPGMDFDSDGDLWMVTNVYGGPSPIWQLRHYELQGSSPYYIENLSDRLDITNDLYYPRAATMRYISDIAISYSEDYLFVFGSTSTQASSCVKYDISTSPPTWDSYTFVNAPIFNVTPYSGMSRNDIEIDHVDPLYEKCRLLVMSQAWNGSSSDIHLIKYDTDFNMLADEIVNTFSSPWSSPFTFAINIDPETRNLIAINYSSSNGFTYYEMPDTDW
ncbi:hypothetical protein J7L05_01555 [bacterium]|nr:hypothetical protein [bacterium]